MSEFSMPWLGLSNVLNKLQFMTWWQNDSFSKAWAHQNFSRQLRKRKGYEEQHSPCCLPPIGNQMSEHRMEACLLALLLLTEELK